MCNSHAVGAFAYVKTRYSRAQLSKQLIERYRHNDPTYSRCRQVTNSAAPLDLFDTVQDNPKTDRTKIWWKKLMTTEA